MVAVASSIIPSILPIILIHSPSRKTSLTNIRKMMLVRITIGRSKNLVVYESAIGAIQALIPRIKNILAILDPNTFPIAISVLPLILSSTDTTSSGILVPIATIVNPMIACEILNFFARDTEPSTRTFHPKVSRTSQKIIDPIERKISIKSKVSI